MNVHIRTLAATLLVLCLMPIRAGHAQQTQHLSLTEAERRAAQNHPQIRASEYSAQAANETVRQVRSAYFPTGSVSLTGAQAASGSRIAAGGLNNPIIFDRFATGFSVSQLITDFGRTRDLVQSSDFRAEAQQYVVDTRRGEVLLQVDRAYFSALRAQSVEKVARETAKARQIVVDQVTALATSGIKAGLDVSFAKVNLAEAQLLLVQAQNDVQAAFTILSAAMGGSDSVVYELQDEPIPSQPPSDIAGLIADALRNRPDIRARRQAGQAAIKLADAERALWYPAISAVVVAGATPVRQVGLNPHYSAIGINLSVPLTSGGLLAARRAEASLKARVEAEQLRDLENLVARDVKTAWLDAQAAFLKLDLTEQLQAHAADAADLAQARYDIGLGSIVELSQAQLNKTRAEIERASAQYDYQIRSAVLKFQIGTSQ
jgi:outer membrane protein